MLQETHEALIRAIQTSDFAKAFSVQKKTRSLYSSKDFSVSELDACVRFISVALNTTGGSVGDVNLYKLLQAYILNPEKRQQINEIIKYGAQ